MFNHNFIVSLLQIILISKLEYLNVYLAHLFLVHYKIYIILINGLKSTHRYLHFINKNFLYPTISEFFIKRMPIFTNLSYFVRVFIILNFFHRLWEKYCNNLKLLDFIE
jgi:hypothetical protein